MDEIPVCAWKMPFTSKPKKVGKPRGYPLKFILKMIPTYFRMRGQSKRAGIDGEPPSGFSGVKALDDGYNQGLPIGGIGAGSIGRSYLGDFARWHLEIGKHHYEPSLANQFHVRIRNNEDIFLQTLNVRKPEGDRLKEWSWGMSPRRAEYHALFPRAWTGYDFSDKGLRMTCRQISPVIGHNYEHTSFPVGVFVWEVENVSETPLETSLMFTWENSINPSRRPKEGDYTHVENRGAHRVLIELGHERTDEVYPVSFAIGVDGNEGIDISACNEFSTDHNGTEVWHDFRREGRLTEIEHYRPAGLQRTGAALCAKTTLEANEKKEIVFVLSWDIPIIRFGYGREWYRRYTRFFDTSGDNAIAIAIRALDSWRNWEKQVIDWQKPILDADIPDWLKGMLFNELYYLVDGGTAWETGEIDTGLETEGVGKFGYLECFDYPFYNTYDVHFYASFALVMNWPKLELSIQRDYAKSVAMQDERERTLLFEGGKAERKPLGVIPHDVGMPQEDPWIALNAYNAQDVGRWKDLNSKFVLQVYRDYYLTGNLEFLKECWPSVVAAMEYLDNFDTDQDGMIENEGFPDQTYDTWTMEGVSAYCGGLYLASVKCMIEMAIILGDEKIVTKYQKILKNGLSVYEEKLWNGEYFNFDSSEGKHSDSIMADQLAGQWYLHASGLEGIIEPVKARKAMESVYKFNVLGYASGKMGAMNGMRPDGSIDNSSMQSAEVWTGTTMGVAAEMIYEGLVDEGFNTAKGIYEVVYRDRGYWFRTPEAWTKDGNFRASMYMRPLSIWAIWHALVK
ncbi:MAG: glucosylceramidase [Candidatus Lokiarchaeota archaeon]|nr:glucosylceramidase [Candidatus Lokiarchaeota archaeon]